MTTQQDIRRWFAQGVADNRTYMLVICDAFDYEDYPVYCDTDAECLATYRNPGAMQRVMEVYDLRMNRDAQLAEQRVFNLPKGWMTMTTISHYTIALDAVGHGALVMERSSDFDGWVVLFRCTDLTEAQKLKTRLDTAEAELKRQMGLPT